jgi:hypothetical protein
MDAAPDQRSRAAAVGDLTGGVRPLAAKDFVQPVALGADLT